MVKGISRQVVVVRSLDTKLFEQAIFLIRDGAMPKHGITEEDILREANVAADTYLNAELAREPHRFSFWGRALWTGIGAALTGTAWLLTLLL